MKRVPRIILATTIALVALGALGIGLLNQQASAKIPPPSEVAHAQGVTVTVASSMSESDLKPILDEFSNRTGVATAYEQVSAQSQLRNCATNGTCPDAAIVPWPGLLAELSGEETLVDLDDFISSTVLNTNYSTAWIERGKVDDALYGVWFNANNKSLIWYDPQEFTSHGWTTATNWTETISLSNEISNTTDTAPWSIGNDSGDATGWPLTDWFENILLRSAGPDVYDGLAAHTIPWTHTEVISAMTYFGDIFGNEGFQLGGKEGTLNTYFADAMYPPFETPPEAYLHSQGSFAQDFITSEFPSQVAGTDYAVFPFPDIGQTYTNAVMGGGDVAMAFNDSDGVQTLINYLITIDAANLWVSNGNTSPNRNVDFNLYPDPNTREAAEHLVNADIFGFDLSDQLPGYLNEYMWLQMDDLVRAAPNQAAMEEVLARIEFKANHPYDIYLPLTLNSYERTLTLGILGPFSGPSSRTGEEFKDAVNMAFSEADWHVGGYKIDPVWIDSQSDPTTATQAYEQAITQDGVQAGLLNWHSSVAVGCMDVVAEHEIPHFAGLGASGVVNDVFNGDQEKYGYWTTKWWPTPGKLNISYVQMLEDAIDSGHWSPSEKTVVIYGEDTDWGHAFGDGIKANFEDAGWSVVAEEYFPYDQTDFTDLMNTLNNLNPAVVAGTMSGDSAAAFINQADATGLNSVIIADGLGWTGDWYGQTGSSSDYVVDQIPGWASDESQAFRQAFEDRYGYTPSPSSGGLAYDAANFFIGVAQATYEQYGDLSSETLYSFTQDQIWTGQWTYTDGVMMEEYKYTEETIPDPVVGEGYYMFPVRQYFDGDGKIIFPPDWAEQDFTPPGE